MFLFPMPIAPHSLPPNPSLVAIILTITTRRGPRFVFHYPDVPVPSQPSNSWAFGSIGSDSEDSDDSSDDEGTINSDVGDTGSRAGSISSTTAGPSTGRQASLSGRTGKLSVASTSTRKTTRTLREDGPDDEDEADEGDIEDLDLTTSESNNVNKDGNGNTAEDGPGGGNKDKTPEWEKVLGYPTEGLEKLLSPSDKFKKKKFEVSIEELVFLGYPVFAREDGSWKKKKKTRKGKAKENTGRDSNSEDEPHGLMNPFASEDTHSKGKGTTEDADLQAVEYADLDSPGLSPTTTRDDFRRPSMMNNLTIPDLDPVSQSYGSTGGLSEVASEATKSISTISGSQNGDNMSMFHVVFVMNPPALEHHIRVEEMYDNVVKKFAKSLRYEQARSGWVEKEAKKILSMKMQAKEDKTPPPMSILWPKIVEQSALARVIMNLYTSIANNKIAHVSIGPAFDASIQIPQAISTSYVATPNEPQLPGLWLTTASMLEDDDGVPTLSPHAALLLLEDRETMLKEVEGEAKETTALAYFIRELNPTKSLQKLSASISLPLQDMQFLAGHLIYWRRARAIPPLHIRDTYIVSPNCDVKRLKRATSLYAQRFHTLPSLSNMLQLLSGKPKQYGYLIPSKDHKAAYMEILAWLLRGGWVTQLRTFAWVKVTPSVKAAVAIQMHREAEEKALAKARAEMSKPDTLMASRPLGSVSNPSLSARRTYSEDDYTSSASTSRKSSRSKASPRLEGGLLSPVSRPRDRSCSDAASTTSGRTVIPIHPSSTLPSPALLPHRPSPLHAVDNYNPLSPPNGVVESTSAPETDSISANSAPGIDTATDAGAETLFSEPNAPLASTEESDYEISLILSPHKANTLESKWLAYIGSQLQDKDLREVWGTLAKHFNGKRAIEEIASREGWKRRRVDELMAKLDLEGVLCVVRHW